MLRNKKQFTASYYELWITSYYEHFLHPHTMLKTATKGSVQEVKTPQRLTVGIVGFIWKLSVINGVFMFTNFVSD